MENSATAIVSNKRNCFTGKFTPTKITLETAKRMTTKTNLIGSIRLVLTDYGNKNHVYIIPVFVFDLEIPINTLVIPSLSKLF